jgi:hypothetical protein
LQLFIANVQDRAGFGTNKGQVIAILQDSDSFDISSRQLKAGAAFIDHLQLIYGQ